MELTPLSLLRTLALAGAASLARSACPAQLPPTEPQDSVSLASRIARDGDGELIVRRGNPDKLGQLVDHGKPGAGPDDLKLLQPQGERGFAVISGKTHPTDMLTVPLSPIPGIESPELVQPGAENYFADAWKHGREQAAKARGLDLNQLPRDAIALAVNSQNERSQDRLHIHADLLDPELGQQLKQQVVQGDFTQGQWALVKPVHGHQYRALWVEGEDLKANPFKLVHDQLVSENGGGSKGEEYARSHMGQHSIAVVAESDANGRPGFLILDGRHGRDPKQPQGPCDSGSAEEWLMNHADTPR